MDGPIIRSTGFLERGEDLGLRGGKGAEVDVFVGVFFGLGESGGYGGADGGEGCGVEFCVAVVVEHGAFGGEVEAEEAEFETLGRMKVSGYSG